MAATFSDSRPLLLNTAVGMSNTAGSLEFVIVGPYMHYIKLTLYRIKH
jgi:hypothetical protein